MDKLCNVKKIAVLRATALGDYVAATPALYALREAYPDAEIVYLGNPWHKSFLEKRPSPIDRVIVIPVSHGVRLEPGVPQNPEELDAFFNEIQHEHFDLGIQMHGGGANSNPFLLRVGAKFNVGMCTPDAPRLDRWMPYVLYQNEIFRLLELVRLVGANPTSYAARVDLIDKDYANVEDNLPELREPFVILHPGASEVRRRWPADCFAQVGDQLAARGYQIVLTGVWYERETVREVIERMRYPAVNACERLSLGGLGALMKRSSLVISNDTGPLHLANALDTPNVGIFWCGNYMNWSHPVRTTHRPLFSWMQHCPFCGKHLDALQPILPDGCQHLTSFVEPVTVEAVMGAANELLEYAQLVTSG